MTTYKYILYPPLPPPISTHPHKQAELRGKRGFVPRNFLEKVLPDQGKGRDGEGVEVFAADEDSMRLAEKLFNVSYFHRLPK